MICAVCKNIDTHDTHEETIHHKTCRSFKESVDLGCYICNELWAELTSAEKHAITSAAESESEFSLDTPSVLADGPHNSSVQNHVTKVYLPSSVELSHVVSQLIVFIDSSATVFTNMVGVELQQTSISLRSLDSLPPIRIRERLPESTKSVETLSLAKSWIKGCVENHQHCNSFTEPEGYYPTRLLYCGASRGPESSCQLIETGSVSPKGPYITLSHCWGLTECLKLTTDNYARLLHDIPLSVLPLLYQDAVYIARDLGVEYLWIDSLCIIQQGDERADWLREGKVMGQVYAHSLCNISAANAPDSHHTLFCFRDPDKLYSPVIDFVTNGQAKSYLVCEEEVWNTQVSSALINTRGWVLQERFLSRRILYFGERQVLWECRQEEAAEYYPTGLPSTILRPQIKFKSLISDHLVAETKSGSKLWAYQWWNNIVHTYTKSELTFPGDKLIAISAVAKFMRDVLQDEYVAGMWRRYLERDLLWTRVVVSTEPQCKIYRCPSWSWAAVDGVVVPGRVYFEQEALLMEVVSFELDYSGDDNTNLVHGGWLQLRGALKQLKLVRSRWSAFHSYNEWDMFVDGVQIGATADSPNTWRRPNIYLDVHHDHFEEQNSREALYYMPATRVSGYCWAFYILLLEVVDPRKGVYRRMGVACVDQDFEKIILARSTREDSFPCEEYKDGLHLIRII